MEPGSDLNRRDVEGADLAPLDACAALRQSVSRARPMDRRSISRFGDPARNLTLRFRFPLRRRLKWTPVPISTAAMSKARIWPRSMPAPPPDRRSPGLGRWISVESTIRGACAEFDAPSSFSAEAPFVVEPGSDLNSLDVEGADLAQLDACAAPRPSVSRARPMDRRSNPRFGDPARNWRSEFVFR